VVTALVLPHVPMAVILLEIVSVHQSVQILVIQQHLLVLVLLHVLVPVILLEFAVPPHVPLHAILTVIVHVPQVVL